jgi:methyl-accepting chemotaxis protein
MNTKIATALAKGDAPEASAELIQRVRASLGGARPELLALFASTAQPLDEMSRRVVEAFPDVPLVSSSTSGEFTERGDAKCSAVLFALAGDYRVHAGIGTGLKADPERAILGAIEGLPREVIGYSQQTAILLLDPLAGNGEEATLIASSLLGSNVRLAGGAAGDDLGMRATYVGAGARVSTDAAVVALIFSKLPLGVGVCHGHAPLSRPLKVTRAHGNVVHEIEGRPAFSVWLEHTREHAKSRGVDVDAIPKDREIKYLLYYEAGLAAGGGEYKIRAPLSRADDGSMSFACGVPEGSVFRITESVPERQIESAREAARRALHQLGRPAAGALVFDCICRNLILESDFERAVRGMSEELGQVPLAGFETYGEIALDAGDMSGFHNTTSVVLAFPK